MGLYIKGMEMPTSCFDCPVSHPALGNLGAAILGCPLIGKTLSAPFCEEKRMDNCPLAPVPPHGRLIDGDALKASLAFAEKTAEWAVPALRAVLMVIDEMPTIIQAEEAET
jgi:hypothetical protein